MESNKITPNEVRALEVRAEGQVFVTVNAADSKPVKVVVVHRHVHSEDRPKQDREKEEKKDKKKEKKDKKKDNKPEAIAPPAAASNDVDSVSSRPILLGGSTVRLQLSADKLNRDGGVGCFLGADADGAVFADFAGNTPNSIFKVEKRGDGISLRSPLTGKNLRCNAKGVVDAAGGNGKWTIFSPIPHLGSSVALKSVANIGKVNIGGEQDWFIGEAENSVVVGNASPTGFVVELVQVKEEAPKKAEAPKKVAEAPLSKEAKAAAQAAKIAEREARKVAQLAKKDARMAEKLQREEEKKQVLLSGWTEVGSDKTSKAKAAKAKSKSMPAEAVPKLVANDDESSKKPEFREVLKEFPHQAECEIRMSPVRFLQVANRKGSQSWNIGVSPQGFLVSDASSGSWGTWVLSPVPKSAEGAFFIISSHTPEFRLAISKSGLVSHKGGKGLFAQWMAQPEGGGKFWSLQSRGSNKFLGVSSSGLLYSADEASKDTRFKIFSSFSK